VSGGKFPAIAILLRVLSVSAVVPCYNGEPFLVDALESIRRQSRPVNEIIVVDDGSTDRSAEVAEKFGATVIRQPNRGEGAARNRGIEAARSDAIAWLDADDLWRPRHIEVVAGLLERHASAAGAFGAVQRFGADHARILGYVPTDEPASVLLEAFQDWLHTTIGAVTRRAALLEVGGFDEDERYSVDFDLWLRLARSHRFVATHQVTADWRWHASQQSSSADRQIAAVYRYRRRFIDALNAEHDESLARSLEHEFARLWLRDMHAAVRSADRAGMEVLREAASLVPALGSRDRRFWMLVTQVPVAAMKGALRIRSLVRRRP
jgi:glycosyltransferase involved in cell wall biosynthesis